MPDAGAVPGAARGVAGALLLSLLIALTGCAGRVIAVGDVSVLVAERTGDAMEALGGGRLEVVGGCLGASGSVIIWPHGTEVVDEDPLTIEVPGVGTRTIGDEVSVGGGYVSEESPVADQHLRAGGVDVPEACLGFPVFLAH